jgi:hypothetical protein
MIGEKFDTSGEMDNVHQQLRDGRKLCQYRFIYLFFKFLILFFIRLMNAIAPNSIPKINTGK